MTDKAHQVEDQHPLKQGLKPIDLILSGPTLQVEDQHPLKQGLKLNELDKLEQKKEREVEDQHPLKQGLKHFYHAGYSCYE